MEVEVITINNLKKYFGVFTCCILFFFEARAIDKVEKTHDTNRHGDSFSSKGSTSKDLREVPLKMKGTSASQDQDFVSFYQDIPSFHNANNESDEIHKFNGKYVDKHFYLPNEKLSGLYSPVLMNKKGALICTGTYRCLFDVMLGDFDNVILWDFDEDIKEYNKIHLELIKQIGLLDIPVSEQRRLYLQIITNLKIDRKQGQEIVMKESDFYFLKKIGFYVSK